MPRKRGIKDKIGLAVYENKDWNKRILGLKKSFDEVNKVLVKKDKRK